MIVVGLVFLAIAIRRERRSNELKSEFISNVSHELKTPLSIISMFGEMLANGRTKSPEQATEYAEIIWRESVRLGRLIDNVLDFAKIERGMGVYEFAESDVGEVVDARDRSRRSAGSQTAEMTLEIELEPELPPMQLDANAFTLAVLNLIDNAIKYAADGKKIELTLKRDGERVVLSVRDFGPGIDARGARADLRAVLSRARDAAQADPRLGHRARARAAHRARARRRHHRRQHARAGRDVPAVAADLDSEDLAREG